MTKILLKCLDHWADGESMEIECELDGRGLIDFEEGPHGTATEQGESYEFGLYDNGTVDFGKEYEGDRFWQTDIHELRIRVGTRIKVTAYGPVWTYEIVSLL